MPTKNTQTGTHKNRASQPDRESVKAKKLRLSKDDDHKAGSYSSPFGYVRLHLLEKQLKKVTLFELATNSGSYDDVLSIVDTEEKQLQCIEDLYAIVKSRPKYKDLKEQVWHQDTRPTEVIAWLLRKLGPVADGDNWTIDTYEDDGKIRYCYVAYNYFYAQWVCRNNLTETYANYGMAAATIYNGEYFIPLDFLPFLLKRDYRLHDMIIDIVALVSKRNGIPFWDNDGDFSQGVQHLIKDNAGINSNNETAYKQMILYTEGAAGQYIQLLIKRRRKVTEQSIRNKIAEYAEYFRQNGKEYSARKWTAIDWINNGLALAKTGKKMVDAWRPAYINPNAFTPERKYKFVWSRHKNDYVKNFAYKKMNREANAHGQFLPVMSRHYFPGKRIEKYSHNEAVAFSAFMSDGFKMLWSRFEEYYYAAKLREEQTPGEQLLERIELMEIHNAIR